MYMIIFLMSVHVCNVPTGNVSVRIAVVQLPLGNASMVIWVHYIFPTNPHEGADSICGEASRFEAKCPIDFSQKCRLQHI
ncbi:hypothetical protein FKM82_031253 [Ascaphus truei]